MKRKDSEHCNYVQSTTVSKETNLYWSVSNIPLEVFDRSEFLRKIDNCAQNWLNEQLNNAFDVRKSTATRERVAKNRKISTTRMSQYDQNWIKSRNSWFQTDIGTLRPICNSLRVDSEDGRLYTFKTSKKCGTPSLDLFLTAQTRVALNGGYIQSTNIHSWTRSGGGIWSHIITGASLRIAYFVYTAIKEYLGISLYSSALPYIVFKPVGGTKEHSHFHTFSPNQLYTHLNNHVSHVDGSSIRRWIIDHGAHATAHLRGGSTMFTISPMTPWRLLICMSIVHPSHFHTGIQHLSTTWWNRKDCDSTYYVPFDNMLNLQIINRILYYFENNGVNPLTYATDLQWLLKFQTSIEYHTIIQSIPRRGSVFIPLCVQSVITTSQLKHNGHIVLCASGFPYGYFSNKNESRVSIRIPISKKRPLINLKLFEHLYHSVHNTREWFNIPEHVSIPYITISQTSRFLRHLYYMVHASVKHDNESIVWLQNNTVQYKCDNKNICPLKMNELLLNGNFKCMFPVPTDVFLFIKQYY
jgi:hypothetical protein